VGRLRGQLHLAQTRHHGHRGIFLGVDDLEQRRDFAHFAGGHCRLEVAVEVDYTALPLRVGEGRWLGHRAS